MASRATPPPFDPYAPKNASQNILLADSGIQLSMIVGVKAGGLHAELDVVVSGMVTNTNHHIFRPDFRPVRQDKAAQHPVEGFPPKERLVLSLRPGCNREGPRWRRSILEGVSFHTDRRCPILSVLRDHDVTVFCRLLLPPLVLAGGPVAPAAEGDKQSGLSDHTLSRLDLMVRAVCGVVGERKVWERDVKKGTINGEEGSRGGEEEGRGKGSEAHDCILEHQPELAG